MERKITVMAVDDHPLMREGIASAVQQASDLQLVAQAAGGNEAVALFRTLRPDVTLMDIQMPDLNGIDALIAIRKEFPEARIIMLTAHRGDAQARRAIKAGAASYFMKSMVQKDLRDVIRLVHSGRRHIPADIAAELADTFLSDQLSAGEIDVLRLASEGHSNKRIGVNLQLSEETVKSRMKSLLTKLQANDRTHAVTIALRRGILEAS